MSKLPELPSVTLTNGIVVANYSSPHTFLFEDGSILDKCSDERALLTMLKDNERVASEIITIKSDRTIRYSNITIEWELSWFVKQDMLNIMKAWSKDKIKWDIIIIPLPVMIAWKAYCKTHPAVNRGPFRAIRLVDRLEPKKVSISKFCV